MQASDIARDAQASGESSATPPRFGIVLILIVSMFVFIQVSPEATWSILVSVALLAIIVLAAIRASGKLFKPRLQSALVALAGLTGSIGALLATNATSFEPEARGGTFLVSAVLLALAPVIVVSGVVHDMRSRGVTVQAVLGAVCVYLLIGIGFAAVYGAVAYLGEGPFFAQGTDGDTQTRLYFSVVTLTSLGFGDFTPADDAGRALTTLETLLGQLYLVTVVALLVGNLGRTALRARD